MSQIKMRSRPRGIPLNSNRNDFRKDTWRRYPDAHSVGWSWRAAGQRLIQNERTHTKMIIVSRGHPGISRPLRPRSTHFEHLTVAWLMSKSVKSILARSVLLLSQLISSRAPILTSDITSLITQKGWFYWSISRNLDRYRFDNNFDGLSK